MPTSTVAEPAGLGPVSPTGAAIARFHPVGLGDVVLAGGGALGDWQRRNGARTMPHCVEQVIASGAVGNLEHVAEGAVGRPHAGMHFSDSDVYKMLEAAAWESIRGLPQEVKEFAERAPQLLARAQRADGYLNSWFQGQHPELIWDDLRWGHELYCAGHLLQAAVASRRAGGSPDLFAVASRALAHLLETFSLEEGDGRRVGVCGHPEVETALVEFYRLTGEPLALQLARRQVDLRGRAGVDLPSSGLLGDSRFPLSYFLHHLPVRERKSATGHAVRELYLQAGVVDVAVETGDEELLRASEAIWEDLFTTKTYVTGAHGSRHRDESIGDAYELPNDRAYAETCAAIASFQWNWRLLLATGRARYAEAMELVLWNTIAGGVSMAGTEFFYSNALHLRSDHTGADEDSPRHRLSWYDCACCPLNLARLVASIQAYLVTRDASGLQVQMPFRGSVSTGIPGGSVELTIDAGHPWEGTTDIEIKRCTSVQAWALSLRAPEWASKPGTKLTVNGHTAEASEDGSYIRVSRRWSAGDRLQVSHSMPVRVLRPHRRMDAARGCAAIQRGPLVYCLEADDLEKGTTLEDVFVDVARPLEPVRDVPAGLRGYVEIAVVGSGRRAESSRQLYNEAGVTSLGAGGLSLTFVPYFA
ncbi:MAG TPA: beta-L-arabinofuranosidase domain-containing protein, partial [Acidimicrobiales bacterium]|nr:beta-L-arabinofuranosidase domain-containing protein [Acidimicrobiales bacterium]